MFKTTTSGMNQTAKNTFQKNGRGIMGQTFHHGISTAEKKLGSIKSGGLNYTRDHTFYYGDNVVAPQVKQAVKAMKDLTDPDLLKLKKPEWTSTVLVPNIETIHESFNHPVGPEKKNSLKSVLVSEMRRSCILRTRKYTQEQTLAMFIMMGGT